MVTKEQAPAAVLEQTKVEDTQGAPEQISQEDSVAAEQEKTAEAKPNLTMRSTIIATNNAPRTGAKIANVANAAKYVAPAPAGTSTSTSISAPADKNDISDLLSKIPAASQYQLLRVQQYIKDMNPLIPVDYRNGAAHQVGLYRALQNIINEQGDNFQAMFTGVLRLIDRNSGEREVFHEYNVFRFLPDVELNADDRRAFTNIISLLKSIANAQTRQKALKMMDHDRMLAYGLTASGRDRVLAYLGL